MKVQHVTGDWVAATWPSVVSMLARAAEYSLGELEVGHIQTMVLTGQWTLIVAHEDGIIRGAATVDFLNRPTQRVAFVTALGGRGVLTRDAFKQFSELLKTFGATHIEGATRESVARLWTRLGPVEKYRIVGAAL